MNSQHSNTLACIITKTHTHFKLSLKNQLLLFAIYFDKYFDGIRKLILTRPKIKNILLFRLDFLIKIKRLFWNISSEIETFNLSFESSSFAWNQSYHSLDIKLLFADLISCIYKFLLYFTEPQFPAMISQVVLNQIQSLIMIKFGLKRIKF